jgi:hypothetical protein
LIKNIRTICAEQLKMCLKIILFTINCQDIFFVNCNVRKSFLLLKLSSWTLVVDLQTCTPTCQPEKWRVVEGARGPNTHWERALLAGNDMDWLERRLCSTVVWFEWWVCCKLKMLYHRSWSCKLHNVAEGQRVGPDRRPAHLCSNQA